MISTQEAIAIAELCVYTPIFLLTVIIVFRHGFKRQSGWIYLAIFCLVLVTLLTITARDVKDTPREDRRLYWVVVAAIPFLGVRLLWSVIAVFGHDSEFSITSGNPWVNFGMAVVEEFVIVCMYTMIGLTIGKGDVLYE